MLYTLYNIFHNQRNFFPWLCINKKAYKFLICIRNSKFQTWFANIMKLVEEKIKTSFWLFQYVNQHFYMWNQLSLQFLSNHHSCLKIRNQIVAAKIQKIPDSLTNKERIISLTILIETWICSNHYVNHDFFMQKKKNLKTILGLV